MQATDIMCALIDADDLEDPDDSERLTLDLNGLADEVRRRAEPAAPERLSQDGDAFVARLLVGGQKETACRRLCSE